MLTGAPWKERNRVTELRGRNHRSAGALFRKLGCQSVFVVDAVASKHDAAFVATLGLFQLAGLFYAEVKESTEVSVYSGTFKLLFGLPLGVPVVGYCGFGPGATSAIGRTKFGPFGVDGSLPLGIVAHSFRGIGLATSEYQAINGFI